MKINKTKILIFLSILIIVGFIYLINLIIGKDGFGSLKSLLSMEQKKIIMKYIFPYKVISQQEAKLSEQQKIITEKEEEFILFLAEMELMIKKINSDIQTTKSIFKFNLIINIVIRFFLFFISIALIFLGLYFESIN